MLVFKNPAPDSAELGYARRALEQGELVVLPTDTVYGLAAHADNEQAVAKLYAAKGRPATEPTAVVFASLDQLHEHVTELSSRASWAISALLPGPWTLIVANPAGVYPWLTSGTPGPLGVRVPAGALDLPPVAASSANLAGVATPTQVADLAPEIIAAVACTIDRGVLGTSGASTVLDLTAWEAGGDIHILRDDAGRAGQAFAALEHAPMFP